MRSVEGDDARVGDGATGRLWWVVVIRTEMG